MFGKMFSRCGALIAVLLLTPAVALAGPGGHGAGGHFGGGHNGGFHYSGGHYGGAHYGGAHYPGFGGLHYGGYHYHYPYARHGYHHDHRAHFGGYYYPRTLVSTATTIRITVPMGTTTVPMRALSFPATLGIRPPM